MKKFALCLCAIAGLAGVFAAPAARADNGPYDDDDSGYGARRARRYEYREDRGDREFRGDPYAHCRRSQVYVVERGCPVRRVVYFDPAGRCFYPAGPRRVYVENYSYDYPRFRRHRPHVGLSFSFGG